MKGKRITLALALLCACLVGALSSNLFAGKKPGTFLEAAKAASLPKLLRAREFHVVDEHGTTRIILDAWDKGTCMTFWSPKKKMQLAILCTDDGAYLCPPGSNKASGGVLPISITSLMAARPKPPAKPVRARPKGAKPETPTQTIARLLEIDEATARLIVRNPGLRQVILAKLGLVVPARGRSGGTTYYGPGAEPPTLKALQDIAAELRQANRDRAVDSMTRPRRR